MIGFIGIGVMGEPICRNLATRSGEEVLAYDINPAPLERLSADGVRTAASVREIAESCNMVFLSLPGVPEVKTVCAGPASLLLHMRAGSYVIDLSTVTVALARDLHSRFAAGGVHFADAPVARTRVAAEKGTLSVMVGSTEQVYQRIPQHYARLLPAPGPYRIVAAAPYRVHERCAPRFRVGGVLLAGDAAHVCNPFGGMGLTSGIIDADALVKVLDAVIQGRAGEEALDFYADERRRVFREVVSPIATSFKRRLSEKDPVQRERDRIRFRQGAENPDTSPTASYLSTLVLGRPMPV